MMSKDATLVALIPGGACDVVERMLSKENPEDPIGVGLQFNRGKLCLTSINQGSDVESSLLSIGDEVLSIDGFSTEHLSFEEALDIFRFASKTVSVKAIKLRETGVVIGEDLTESIVEDPLPR